MDRPNMIFTQDPHAIGEFVRQVRIQRQLSQTELAGRVGCTPGHLANIEKGTKFPALPLLMDVLKQLGKAMAIADKP